MLENCQYLSQSVDTENSPLGGQRKNIFMCSNIIINLLLHKNQTVSAFINYTRTERYHSKS
jgi:hypothetical protein